MCVRARFSLSLSSQLLSTKEEKMGRKRTNDNTSCCVVTVVGFLLVGGCCLYVVCCLLFVVCCLLLLFVVWREKKKDSELERKWSNHFKKGIISVVFVLLSLFLCCVVFTQTKQTNRLCLGWLFVCSCVFCVFCCVCCVFVGAPVH